MLQIRRRQFRQAVADDEDAPGAGQRLRGRGERRHGGEQSDDERRSDTPAIRHRSALYRTGPVLAAIALALALASCGGGGSTTQAPPTSPAASRVKASAKEMKPVSSHPAAKAAPCQARIGDLVDRMDDLRQSLLAGLDYSEYVLRVQAVRAAYEAVPVGRLGLACVAGPANHAEDAFDQYLRAANLWGECAGTAGCAASSIESRLQHRWRIASKSLDAAKKPT
jgi:hypothetical protein